MASKCAPHDWLQPLPGDDALECAVCGRRIGWDAMEPWRWAAISKAYRKRRGQAHGDRFARAANMAGGLA